MSGIEWAPIRIPIERRLQTLAVLCWISTFTLLNTVGTGLFLYVLFYSSTYRWMPILYMAWAVYDWKTPEQGGRKWKYTPFSPMTKYFRDYFPIEMVKTADLNPERKYLLCSHPHGVMPAGINIAVGTNACGWDEKFPGLDVRFCTLPINFTFLGLHREIVLGSGFVSSTKASIEYLFSQTKGIVTVLVPGGAHEARNWSKDKVKLYLNKRKGFIKLCLRFGVDLVPTFSFNEQFIFRQITAEQGSFLMKVYNFVESTLGFIPVLFFGRGVFNYTFGLLPYRKPIHVVVGKPIEVKRIENPTREEIENMHATYVKELQKLYEKYNPIYGDKSVKLVIE